MNTDERIRELRKECDNYNRSLEALKALAHEMLWDAEQKVCAPEGRAYFGRRMHPSSANRIAKGGKLTPDLVGQRTPTTGFIVELKASVPENSEHRRQTLKKVEKYDDDLTGWPTTTEKLARHDLILLIDYPNSEVIKKDVEEMLSTNQLTCVRPFALVYFNHHQRSEDTWVALHLISGRVSDDEKRQKLSTIHMMHPENIAANPIFGKVLIYDARPPLPLLMLRLYTAVVSNLSEDEALRLRVEGQVQKPYRLSQLKEILAEYCCPEQTDPRVPNLPDTKWLKAAVRMWEELGWAAKSQSQAGCFDIIIKKTRREPFEQFLRVCAEADRKKQKKKEKEQERQQKLDEKIREDNPLFAHLLDGNGNAGRKNGGDDPADSGSDAAELDEAGG
jgi:hypothetical protein